MILDPVNSITSVNFYKKISTQSLGRSILYLCYLAALFSITGTVALKVKAGPVIKETFRWLEQSMPPLTFSRGKVSSPVSGPLTLRHPKMAEVALIIDTQRGEPATPELMGEQKVIAYLTGNALYLLRSRNRVESYDFSKSPSRTVVVNAEFYRMAEKTLRQILYPIAIAAIFVMFLAWKTCASLMYSLIALAVNAQADARLGYKSLFNITVYAQTLVIALQSIFLFMPVGIPLFRLAAFALTGLYIWLAVNKIAAPQTPEPAA